MRKLITKAAKATPATAKAAPATVKAAPVAAPTKPAGAVAKPATVTAAPPAADKPATTSGGAVNRAAVRPQLYGAEQASSRDDNYLRFFASFLRGRQRDATVTYLEIAERCRPCNGRNPIDQSGKNGALDRGILSRFDKFGYTVNVADAADKSRRVGFRFSPKALDLAAVKLGMRDVYDTATGKRTTVAS